MRAKLATDGIEDVGLMVTTAARFRRGSFSITVRGGKVQCDYCSKPTKPGKSETPLADEGSPVDPPLDVFVHQVSQRPIK
ncbi:hypothetical protein XENOCAPTIV_011399 [Xenoophorus captivus]|uniref:Uncharacterized protein n=1 Tax=Xenoophorus captivus TaxID=1517983 RepID=A0ABV0RTZ6_9TELE